MSDEREQRARDALEEGFPGFLVKVVANDSLLGLARERLLEAEIERDEETMDGLAGEIDAHIGRIARLEAELAALRSENTTYRQALEHIDRRRFGASSFYAHHVLATIENASRDALAAADPIQVADILSGDLIRNATETPR